MPSSTTEYVLHGPKNYIDYGKNYGNHKNDRCPCRVSAFIISNLLAVYLALAAKSVYNILRRVLRFYTARYAKKKTEVDVTTVAADSPTRPNVDSTLSASAAPENTTNGISNRNEDVNEMGSDVSGRAISFPENAVIHAEAPLVPDTNQRAFHRMEVIDAAHDNETMMMKTYSKFFKGLLTIIPVGALSNPTRMFDPNFWEDAHKFSKDSTGDLLWHLLVGTAALLLYFGTLLLSILSGNLVIGDSVALSRHPQCGLSALGDFDKSNMTDGAYHTQLGTHGHNIARESRQYSQSCYDLAQGPGGAPNADSCGFFYERSIKYVMKDNDTCPFWIGNDHLCLEGENSAYSLHTGTLDDVLISASAIGINTPIPYKFYRSMSCAPLKVDNFVSRVDTDDDSVRFRYSYGTRSGDDDCPTHLPNCTFDLPVYRSWGGFYYMSSVGTDAYPREQDDWKPVFKVDESLGQSAAIMLISTYGTSYPEQSMDPIFPAETNFGDGRYFNTQWHASVLGCMEQTLICKVTKKSHPRACYSLYDFSNLHWQPKNRTYDAASMFFFSLLPTLQSQLIYLQGSCLNAQSLLTGWESSKIAKEQWKIETRQMFESMLARSQIAARNIARGTPGVELPDEHNIMEPRQDGICNQYKFRTVGWKNISVTGLVLELLAGALLWIVGITRENHELGIEWYMKCIYQFPYRQACDPGLTKLRNTSTACWDRMCEFLCSIPSASWAVCCDLWRKCVGGVTTSTRNHQQQP